MLNLKQEVRDYDNSKMMVDQQMAVEGFDEPVGVTFQRKGETVVKEFVAGIPKAKYLSFRHLFMKALREKSNKGLDIDRKSELVGKLFADTADLNEEDRADILKSVKNLDDPLLVHRTREFFRANPITISNGQTIEVESDVDH